MEALSSGAQYFLAIKSASIASQKAKRNASTPKSTYSCTVRDEATTAAGNIPEQNLPSPRSFEGRLEL
jgi:hypothetical protein